MITFKTTELDAVIGRIRSESAGAPSPADREAPDYVLLTVQEYAQLRNRKVQHVSELPDDLVAEMLRQIDEAATEWDEAEGRQS